MEGRNSIFVALRTPAVALSEALLTLNTPQKDIKSLESRLEALHHVVKSVAGEPSFDSKLADYAFFPIAQTLKHSQQVSLRCLELCLSIVAVLIRDGWNEKIDEALARQLLALCTLLASKGPPSPSIQQSSPELQTLALECLKLLISPSSDSKPKSFLIGDASIPQLGQMLSTILERLEDGISRDVQASAAAALESFTRIEWPALVLWNFLPGIISSLTKVLRPTTQQRRPATIILSSLHILCHLLKTLFGSGAESAAVSQIQEASVHIRTALTSVSRLESHEKAAVRDAVSDLFLVTLQDCSDTLSNCVELAVETVITIAGASSLFKLSMLVSHSQQIKAALQSALHDWSISLVRVMQATDERKKIRRISQIESAYQVLSEASVDLTTVNQTLSQCLTEAVVALLRDSAGADVVLVDAPPSTASLELSSVNKSALRLSGGNDRLDIIKQRAVTDKLTSLIRNICAGDGSDTFVATLSTQLSDNHGTAAVGHFWLATTALRTKLRSSQELDSFLQIDGLSDSLTSTTDKAFETLYFAGLGILTTSREIQTDVRLQALALQALALRAQSVGREFRFELVDALYPVLDALAEPSGQLYNDSIDALNTISKACEYASVRDLIIDNVDYLTNAVALKLNAFDVSPQAPQILLLMIQLAGPALLPYLDDSIESIFAALEDFHGYPLLVELLFRTLAAMAEEGSKAPALSTSVKAIGASVHVDAEICRPTTIHELANIVRDRTQEQLILDSDPHEQGESAPQQPWKSDTTQDEEAPSSEIEKTTPPAPKTYELVFKITEMSQHFLPSASPSLRLSLLSLICTTVPAIAKHEDSFLPLVNTLWPEVVSRLDEEEPAIVAAALDAIAILCEHAKSFMRSRITDLWPRICAIWRELSYEVVGSGSTASGGAARRSTTNVDALIQTTKAIEQSVHRMMHSPADYSNTSLRRQWEALVHMLTTIVQHVPIGPELLDDALEMVKPDLADPAVESVFTSSNADAVWLCKLKSGMVSASGLAW